MTDRQKPLIAVIEDEEHRTHHEADGNAALAWLLAVTAENGDETPAAILLDVMLPGRDGFSIVRALREAGRYTPVLLLTARGRSEDILEGFAAGADDYLPKPFDLSILFARLTSLLRRTNWQAAPSAGAPSSTTEIETITLNRRTIDFSTLEIRSEEKTTHLTLMEADLLRYLLDRPNKIIARKELLENVWRVHEDTDTRAIDNFIVRLRRYLESDPAKPTHLLSVRGVGYRFVPEP
jgi:DNA-binding response OmpR family regulator